MFNKRSNSLNVFQFECHFCIARPQDIGNFSSTGLYPYNAKGLKYNELKSLPSFSVRARGWGRNHQLNL